MNDLKKKILLEGLVNTPSLLAVASGFASLLTGIASGGIVLSMAGLAFIIGGIGWSFTNLTLRYDDIKSDIMRKFSDAKKEEKRLALDDLDRRLILDKDPKDQRYLRQIRKLYDELHRNIEEGKIEEIATDPVIERIDELFQVCVNDLEYSYRLWEAQRIASRADKKKLKEQREIIIDGVGKSVDNFSEAVTALMTLGHKRGNIAAVTAKLDEDLEVAKRVEEQMNQLENPTLPNFDEYLH